MTVHDSLIRDTDTLVYADKLFYPLRIHVAHQQLRHYLGVLNSNVLYYATNCDIYSIDVETKVRSHICDVPFEIKCMAAGHGWVCAAGGNTEETNRMVIVRLQVSATDAAQTESPTAPRNRPTSPVRPLRSARPVNIRIEELTEDILNSISIHKFEADDESGSEEVVAVITSNDQTVRIYSLTLNQEVSVLNLPFQMNHASIAPNGQTLVAVGDESEAYFYKRVSKQGSHSKGDTWQVFNTARLHVPDQHESVGYFTTAWSPSGALCAVGSEAGYITLFDTELLRNVKTGEDAVLDVIGSTRPVQVVDRCMPGAIRCMMFSPAPWDLLVWAEDQGRVVVADVRTGLRVRQVIEVGVAATEKHSRLTPNLTSDMHSQLSHERQRHEADIISLQSTMRAFTQAERRLQQYVNSSLVDRSMSPEFLETLTNEHRRLQQLGSEMEARYNALTIEERRIVDLLTTTGDYQPDRAIANPGGHSTRPEREGQNNSTGSRSGPPSSELAGSEPSRTNRDRIFDHNSARSNDWRRQDIADSSSSTASPSLSPSIAQHSMRNQTNPEPTHRIQSTADALAHAAWSRPPSSHVTIAELSAESSRPLDLPESNPLDSVYGRELDQTSPLEQGSYANSSAQSRSSNPSTTEQTGPAAFIQTSEPLAHHSNPAVNLNFTGTTSESLPHSMLSWSPIPSAGPELTSTLPRTSNQSRSSFTTQPNSGQTSSVILTEGTTEARSLSRRVDDAGTVPPASLFSQLAATAATYRGPGWLTNSSRFGVGQEYGELSAGLAMSRKGDILWCASEKGILECRINLWSRMFAQAAEFT